MTETIAPGGNATGVIPAGFRLTVTTDAGTALIDRLQGGVVLDHVGVAAASTAVLGEYREDVGFHIASLDGSLTWALSQDTGAVRGLLQATVAVANVIAETTATPVDVCTLLVPAGDWDLSAVVDRVLTGTTATIFGAGISLTANTMPTQPGGSGLGPDAAVIQRATFGTTVTGNYVTAIPAVPVSFAVDTTVHLVAADTFSAGSIGVYGTIRARRR